MPNIKWTRKDIITAGVDVGSVGSKAAIMVNGKLTVGASPAQAPIVPESAKKALDFALQDTGLKSQSDLKYIVGTGYGRVNVPMANKAITEIACHAKGANYIWGPSVRTVLDVGGQDIKAIKIDDTGRVVSFLMNDKCAAGTGRGMEVFADLLQIPIEEIGDISLKVEKEPEP
jgi:predicted CoA-substrate-specific enzyme activase